MANLTYRTSATPTVPTSTTVSAGDTPLTSAEIDGNLKSLDNELATKANLSGATFTGTVTQATDAFSVTSSSFPSVAPTLDLDFTNCTVLDSRITFTRATTATRVNEKGLIETVAANVPRFDYDPVTLQCKGLLIDYYASNLLYTSEQFYWTAVRQSILRNATLAPDGTMTGTKLAIDTSATIDHYVIQSMTLNASQSYTYSLYVKAAEYSHVTLWMSDVPFGGVTQAARYNVANSTVVGIQSGTGVAKAYNAGNGWTRISLTVTTTVGGACGCIIMLSDGSTNTLTGDGVSGVYIWGAQLQFWGNLTTYVPSVETFTGRASTGTFVGSNGLIQTAGSGVARMNYNPANLSVAPKLLYEPARTNLLLWSEDFTNAAWSKSNTTVTSNAIVSPDGTTTADSLLTTVAGGLMSATTNPTITAGSTVTVSIYAKKFTSNFIRFELGNLCSCWFNLSTGETASNNAGSGNVIFSAKSIVDAGNGWYRCLLTVKTTTITSISVALYATESDGNGSSLNSSTYIWGAQLESGPYPTSYIPTTTAAVTRAADTTSDTLGYRDPDMVSIVGNNFNNFFNPKEGTFVVSTDSLVDDPGLSILYVTRSENVWGPRLQFNNPQLPVWYNINNSNVTDFGLGTTDATYKRKRKTAVAYKTNDFAKSTDGVLDGTDATVTLPTGLTQLRIGHAPDTYGQTAGCISSIKYYPTRLPNAQLQALSTQ